ncbi:hypothetical protein EIP91_009719 [Steccherinum ochraceum]|uniref:Uncharacterized protein n=1 Tax=Steccherinum ochraceum TaxID=92696 RepID=A0A4R0R9D8_9APHY|nr:hypothetical protein EIP91_009719 [Steccherinum ochraceum]
MTGTSSQPPVSRVRTTLFVEPHSQPLRFVTKPNTFAMDAFTKVTVVEEVEIPSDFEGGNGGNPTSGCVVA